MGHLNKYQYSYRNESASRRVIENSRNSALTDEQHEALSNLCKARHELHSNIDSCIINDCHGYKKELIVCNIAIGESGLSDMSFIPSDITDYIDIDDFQCLYEIETVPEDEMEKQNWYDDNYSRIYSELELLNSNIEKFLREIDVKYGTNYCPTGNLRIM